MQIKDCFSKIICESTDLYASILEVIKEKGDNLTVGMVCDILRVCQQATREFAYDMYPAKPKIGGSSENPKKEPEKECATQESAGASGEKRSAAELTVADLFKFWDILADYNRRGIGIGIYPGFIKDSTTFAMGKGGKKARVDISRIVGTELTVKRVLDDLEIRLGKENER